MAKQGSLAQSVDDPDPAAIGAARTTAIPASHPRLLFFGALGPDFLPDYGPPLRTSNPNFNSNSNSKGAFECIRFPRDIEVSVSHFAFVPAGVDTFANPGLNSYKGQTSLGHFDVVVHFVLGNSLDDLSVNDFKSQSYSQMQADVLTNSYICAYNGDNGISTFHPHLPENLACKMIIIEGSFQAITVAVYGTARTVKGPRPYHSNQHTGDDYHYDLTSIAEVAKEEIPRPDLDRLGQLIEKSKQLTKHIWTVPEVTDTQFTHTDPVDFSDTIRLAIDVNRDSLSNQLQEIDDSLISSSNLTADNSESNNELAKTMLDLFRQVTHKSFGSIDSRTQTLLFKTLGNVGFQTSCVSILEALLDSIQFSQNSHAQLSQLQAIAKCIQNPKVTPKIYQASDPALSTRILPILKMPNIRQDIKDVICQIVDICDLHSAIADLPNSPAQSFQLINYHLCKNIDFSAKQNHTELVTTIIFFLYSCLTTFIDFYLTGKHGATVEQIAEFTVLLSQTSEGLDFLSHITASISLEQQSMTEELSLLSFFQSIPSVQITSAVTPVPLSGRRQISKQQFSSLLLTLIHGSKLVKQISCLGDDTIDPLGIKKLILSMRAFGHSHLERQSLANAIIVHKKWHVLLQYITASSEGLEILAWVFDDMRSFELFSIEKLTTLKSAVSSDVHLQAFLYVLDRYGDHGIKGLLGLLREQRDITSCYGDTLSILKLRYAVSFMFYKCLNAQGLAEVLEYETADYGTADYGNCLIIHLLQYVDHAVTVIRRDEALKMENNVSGLINIRERHKELKILCSSILNLARNIMVLIYSARDSTVSKRHWSQSDVNEFNKEKLMPAQRQTMTRTNASCVFSLISILDVDNDKDVYSSAQIFLEELTKVAIKDAKAQPVYFSAHAISLVTAELVTCCNRHPLSAPSILRAFTNLIPSEDKKLECKLWSEQFAPFASDISDILMQLFQSVSDAVSSTIQGFVDRAVRMDVDIFGFTKLVMGGLLDRIKERAKYGFADIRTSEYSFQDIVYLRAGLHFLRAILTVPIKTQELIILANQHSLLPLLRAVDKDGGSTSVLDVISNVMSLLDPLVVSEQVDAQELLNRYIDYTLSGNQLSRATSPIGPGTFGMLSIQQQAHPLISMKSQNDNSRKNFGGGKAYQRNEFRSIHINRKANTSRPPSVHVDDFSVGNIPQNQQHPETPVEVQSLAARRFEQGAAIAAAVARQQKVTTDVGTANPSTVLPYSSQRLVDEALPFIAGSIRGSPAGYPVGMQPLEWNPGGNASNSLHME